MKKILNIIFAFCLIFILFDNINAESVNVISNEGGSVEIGDVTFERKITSISEDNKELVFTLKFINSKETEIMFIMDDSTNISVDNKNSLNNLAENIVTNILDNYDNTSFGIYTIHPYGNNTTTSLSPTLELNNNKNEILSKLNLVKTSDGNDGEDFTSVLNTVSLNFSNTAENKIIYLFLSGFNTNNVDKYKTALNNLPSNIHLVTVLLDFKNDANNNTPISTLFGSTESPNKGYFYNIATTDINDNLKADMISKITSKYPTSKNTLTFAETFTKEIYENFNFTLIDGHSGSVSEVNNDIYSFKWSVPTLSNNKDAELKYKLVLKSSLKNVTMDESYNINGPTTITVDTNTRTYDNSGLIEFTNSVNSPKTGIADVVIPFATVAAIAMLTYVYVRRKDKLAQI